MLRLLAKNINPVTRHRRKPLEVEIADLTRCLKIKAEFQQQRVILGCAKFVLHMTCKEYAGLYVSSTEPRYKRPKRDESASKVNPLIYMTMQHEFCFLAWYMN